jgi:hypothetical protein
MIQISLDSFQIKAYCMFLSVKLLCFQNINCIKVIFGLSKLFKT